MSKPAPGSPEAVEMGCLCPVMDNGRGRGVSQDANGNWLHWINNDCPVHGQLFGEPDDDEGGE